MPRLNKNDQKIQDSLETAMRTVQDYMATGRHKSIILTHIETAKLIHKGVSERDDTK